ncbi:hypothetical protein XvhCFBP2543_15600 [Xanthomonas vasicola]|uniref:Uncharacterized protein n=1 Tax=Xanthomonas vasicola TaxID=56459 RepID=A0ABD7S623_XANVA|nr:hypothetical protein NX81_007065 [Xanthomonas vasicola]PPV01759.1 hypothetical protein XvhCFBP2543_15600 [Xanthomonas vasicola]TWQ27370.1 hypothetical protein FQJ97_06500 [Xanthomonas vasicola]TWQ39932.1 hypothetical protein FQJ96_08595 [Xanthomonas vasicola]TWQ49233.1 hypothetical protein FQK01_22440 [Xanthomonas vasicola]
MDEAKAVAAGYGERAPVNRGIPTQSARNGEIPKIQTPLFGTTRHPALSGLVDQTFPRSSAPPTSVVCRVPIRERRVSLICGVLFRGSLTQGEVTQQCSSHSRSALVFQLFVRRLLDGYLI